MKKIFSMLACLFVVTGQQTNAQSLLWSNYVTGQSAETSKHCVVDSAGNTYIIGMLNGSIDFDPGVGSTLLNSTGGSDIYLAKCDPSGSYIWAYQIGGQGTQTATRLMMDDAGYLVICGSFTGQTDVHPKWDLVSLDAGLKRHGFIIKLDLDGELIWAKQIAGDDVTITDITINGSKYYFSGAFQNSMQVQVGSTPIMATSRGKQDVVVGRLSAAGDMEWIRTIGGNGDERATAIASSGTHVVVAGLCGDTIDFDPDTSVMEVLTGDQTALFVLKLDQDSGRYAAHGIMAGGGTASIEDMTCNNAGNVWLTGTFSGSMDFDPQSDTTMISSEDANDVFVIYLGPSLYLGWKGVVSGAGDQTAKAMCIDANSNVLITGSFSATTDFDPGDYEYKITANGPSDIYILEIDAQGKLVCAITMGGPGGDGGTGITLDGSGNVVLAGYYSHQYTGSCDLDPGPGQTLVPSYNNNSDLFIAGYSQCAEPVGITENGVQQLVVYPNPSSDAITIKNVSIPCMVQLFDSGGQLVKREVLRHDGTVDLHDLAPGLYHMQCISEGTITRCNVVKR